MNLCPSFFGLVFAMQVRAFQVEDSGSQEELYYSRAPVIGPRSEAERKGKIILCLNSKGSKGLGPCGRTSSKRHLRTCRLALLPLKPCPCCAWTTNTALGQTQVDASTGAMECELALGTTGDRDILWRGPAQA